MCQNTNHLVPPEIAGEAIRAAVNERVYEGYPYAPGDPELVELVRRDFGVGNETACLVTAGGTETLYMICRALLSPGDEVVASDPSYLIIHRFVELSGARTVNLDIYAPPYRLTAERVRAAITPKTRMILLIDPLNPLGSGYPADEVRAIAEIARERDLWLLDDVTYRDFSEGHALALAYAPERTLTVWSVSKNCGLAGLRLGGLLAAPEAARAVARFNTNDLGVNALAQRAAIAALRTKGGWFPRVRELTRRNQERIREAVEATPHAFLPLYPSRANMFAVDISASGVSPEALQREMLTKDGVFVRAGNYLSPQFGQRFVRVSFSNPPEDIERFARSFPRAMAALGGRARSGGA
jgi:aspartate/methionine/tyrosine aminotransferase